MIKRLFGAIVLLLAMNFLIVAGGVGYLWKTGALDRERVTKIKELVFPPTSAPTTAPDDANSTTQPSADPLAKLMAGVAPRSASDQVDFISKTFDSQMAIIDRRQMELADLQRQIETSRQQVEKEKADVEAARAQLVADQQAAAKQTDDAGFQTCLNLYISMPPGQVKQLFLQMDDAAVGRYLSAMQPRQASKIIREFKQSDEIDRIHRILATMRPDDAAAANASTSANGAGSGNAANPGNAGAASGNPNGASAAAGGNGP